MNFIVLFCVICGVWMRSLIEFWMIMKKLSSGWVFLKRVRYCCCVVWIDLLYVLVVLRSVWIWLSMVFDVDLWFVEIIL